VVAVSVHVDQEVFGGELSIGRELDGRFTVLEKLGEGGMGALYRAHQHSVDREVAIKVIRADLVANPEAIKLFLREAKLTSKLNHPNAVGVLDFGQTEDGVFYLVMELVKGRPLDQVLRDEGVLSPARVVRIGMQVCEALEKAHEMQIVHRDLKPANIMLLDSRRDFVKVLDFGLAKTLEAAAQQVEIAMGTPSPLSNVYDPHVTTLLGTPAFLPPERSMGGAADARSDLYSLGCVLYMLASGTLPFKADSPRDVVVAHSKSRPTPLANIPPSISRVIDKMIAREPNDRFQTAADARDALEEAATFDNVLVYQSSPSLDQARQSIRMSQPSIEVPRVQDNRRLTLAIGGAIVAILLLSIILVVTLRAESPAVEAAEPVTSSPRVPAPTPPPPPPVAPVVEPTPAVVESQVAPVIDKTVKKKTPPSPVRVVPKTQPPTPPPPANTGKPKLPF
jgi:eukaryotic-like serine/threonine-protein kinase